MKSVSLSSSSLSAGVKRKSRPLGAPIKNGDSYLPPSQVVTGQESQRPYLESQAITQHEVYIILQKIVQTKIITY